VRDHLPHCRTPQTLTPDALSRLANHAVERERRTVVLSLSGAHQLHIPDLVALVRLHGHLSVTGHALVLRDLSPSVTAQLRGVGLDDVLGEDRERAPAWRRR
jgi:hypothetical protein